MRSKRKETDWEFVFFAIFVVFVVFLACVVLGVGVWAVVKLVNHFTTAGVHHAS